MTISETLLFQCLCFLGIILPTHLNFMSLAILGKSLIQNKQILISEQIQKQKI